MNKSTREQSTREFVLRLAVRDRHVGEQATHDVAVCAKRRREGEGEFTQAFRHWHKDTGAHYLENTNGSRLLAPGAGTSRSTDKQTGAMVTS